MSVSGNQLVCVRVRAARVGLLVYNGTRPSSPPVTHIMGRHHRAQRPVQVTWESGHPLHGGGCKVFFLLFTRKLKVIHGKWYKRHSIYLFIQVEVKIIVSCLYGPIIIMMFHFFAFSFLYLHLGFIPCSFSSQSVLPSVVPLLSKSFSQTKSIVEDAE